MNIFNILLVEDDEVDVMNVQRAFKKCNFVNPVLLARDGLEALQLLRSGSVPSPVLVLLDLNMPRMNGIEFLAYIRSNDNLKSLIIVVLTTSNEDRDKLEAYQSNVAGYMLKPVKFEDFIVTMTTLGKYWTLSECPPVRS